MVPIIFFLFFMIQPYKVGPKKTNIYEKINDIMAK